MYRFDTELWLHTGEAARGFGSARVQVAVPVKKPVSLSITLIDS